MTSVDDENKQKTTLENKGGKEEPTPQPGMLSPFTPKFTRPPKTDILITDPAEHASLDGEANPSARRLTIEKTNFTRGTSETPLLNEMHGLILLNITHQQQRPRHQYPGFRILGAFPNERALYHHVNQYYKGSYASLRMTPVHQLMTICESDVLQDDPAHNKRQIEALVKIYSDAADARDVDFKKNVENGSTGSVGESIYKSRIQCIKTMEKKAEHYKSEHENDGVDRLPHNISASAQISDQRFAVVIILSDIRPVVIAGDGLPEPCVAILDVFSTEEHAMVYAKQTATNAYPKCDVDVVDMYVWHFPENIHPDKIKDVYGHKRLNEVMEARKENSDLANDYQLWCKENDIEPTAPEVDGENDIIPDPMSDEKPKTPIVV